MNFQGSRRNRAVAKLTAAALVALSTLAVPASAQSAAATSASDSLPADPRPALRNVAECWRFGFGAWKPALDWGAAGHPHGSAEEYLASVRRAPGGVAPSATRDSSNASWSASPGDTALILYPDWWPAGIAVRLENAAPGSDTVRGIATALVADATVQNPVSRIVAISRRCG